ncbi:hypothetical protein Q8A67_000414 [Cirrhinus molitorella]|uniref:Uncharacterized protein n=1 Tax=Cirrhinus molitorella TaxID=172907 RepID=A0AA88QJP0_9TELE|nr:hypothetical protein Q8A67_000414 [Cirrhinus molitorella]
MPESGLLIITSQVNRTESLPSTGSRGRRGLMWLQEGGVTHLTKPKDSDPSTTVDNSGHTFTCSERSLFYLNGDRRTCTILPVDSAQTTQCINIVHCLSTFIAKWRPLWQL